MRQTLAWLLLVALLMSIPVFTLVLRDRTVHEDSAVIAVFPHPDDEFQAWSLLEDRPKQYKVFLIATRGESTGFCGDALGDALQFELGEQPPSPVPEGKWTESCEEARANSLIGFLSQMSETDSTIPGDFTSKVSVVAPNPDSVELCRVDGEEGEQEYLCGEEAREVWLWIDRQGKGAVAMFNLGDGNLNVPEVDWAVSSLIEQWEDWGLPADWPPKALIGGFSNYSSERCYTYPHPDHHAVEQALSSINFGVGPQLGATCFLDPRRSLTAVVSADSMDAAFSLSDSGEGWGRISVTTDGYTLKPTRWRSGGKPACSIGYSRFGLCTDKARISVSAAVTLTPWL